METVQIEEMFPWQLARAMADCPLCYVPLGVLEWHGEHNAVGLDAIKAHGVCVAAARRSGGVVVPPLYWATDSCEELPDGTILTGGVEHGERYHVPGNMFYLRPETYTSLLLDMYTAMRRRGFKAIVVLAGHWSKHTLPSVAASGAAFRARYADTGWLMLTDQEVVPGMHYPHEHAAGGETSLLMALRPELVDLSRTLETNQSLRDDYAGMPGHLARREATAHKYIGVLRGVDDESNDPELTASRARGVELLEAIAQEVAARAHALLAAFA